jgi:hypothetical protein
MTLIPKEEKSSLESTRRSVVIHTLGFKFKLQTNKIMAKSSHDAKFLPCGVRGWVGSTNAKDQLKIMHCR